MEASPALIPTRTLGAERPPRLVLRFAAYTGLVLLVAGLATLFVLERDVTSRAEHRVESQGQAVAEATLRRDLNRADFSGPVSVKRRTALDQVFKDRVFLAGVVQASLYDADGIGVRSAPTAVLWRDN